MGDQGAGVLSAVVTPEAVRTAIRAIAGDRVDVGPIPVGPGSLVTATAVGQVASAVVTEVAAEPLEYAVRLPLGLTMELRVGGRTHLYTAECEVAMSLTAGRVDTDTAVVAIAPVSPSDVGVHVRAQGVQARLFARVGDMDNEIRRQVAAYVQERIDVDAPAYTTIDLTEQQPAGGEDGTANL